MMSPVSLRPVMKMTGTCARPLSCLSWRVVSKPSMPGITASIRITSGVTRAIIASACAPSRATSTVMPASSMASVSMRSVSGESSTTRTMSRAADLDMGTTDRCQCCIEAPQVETVCQHAQLPDQRLVAHGLCDQLIEFRLDPAHVSDFAQAHQLVDVVRTRRVHDEQVFHRQRGLREQRAVVSPFDVEQHMDGVEELTQVHRLHQIAVMQPLGLDLLGLIGRERGQHHDGGALAAGKAQPPCDLPAVHFGHRDVEQDEVWAML